MLLNAKEREDIGLEYVFEKLEIMTPYGEKRQGARRLYRPSQEAELKAELEAVLLFTQELSSRAYPLHELQYEFCRLRDISGSINRALRGAILDEVELFEIKGFTRIVTSLKEKIKSLKMPQGFSLRSLDAIDRLLDPEASGLMTFYIYDGYSDKLGDIRRSKKLLEEEIYGASGVNREELLLKRTEFVVREEQEEREIRKALSQKISESSEDFKHNMDSLACLDHWIAKAKLARSYSYCLPEFSESMMVELEEATSPMMEDLLRSKMESFQKISLGLTQGSTIVTGANMGGKSVSLKTLVLNVLLVHLGMLPFAKTMKLGLMDFVFYLGDDYEDVRSGLSSFGAEIIKIRDILKRTEREKGLVVLDEPGRGTNPKEGRALVKALAREFLSKPSILILATHFDGIVEDGMTHYQIRGFEGVDFKGLEELDLREEKALELLRSQMDYRLERVQGDREVPKDALRICRLLGLEARLVESIEKLL